MNYGGYNVNWDTLLRIMAISENADVSLEPLVENQKALGLVLRTFETWIIVLVVANIITWI